MLTPALVGNATKAALESERLPPAALAELQERKLRDLLQYTAARSVFYARLYQSIDLDRAPLTDLPTVNKEIIQKNFDEVVTDPRLNRAEVKRFCDESVPGGNPWYLNEFIVLLTSGTSGQRGCYVWDTQMLAEAVAQGYRQSNRGPTAEQGPHRIAAIAQIDPCDATNVLLSMIPEFVGPKKLIDIRQDFATVCRQLEEFQPTTLAAYPYMLWLLSEEVRAGRLHIRPSRINSSADVLSSSDRAAIRAVFGVEPYNYYCATEVPYLAWECDAHQGLHVNADYVILESVDAQNRPVPPDRMGDKVLVTNLSNRALPLVRYEISDQVEYMEEPCPCGCLLPRVRTVAGRIEHILFLPGVQGNQVRLIEEHVDDIVGRVEGVAKYQVIEEESDRLTVNVICEDRNKWNEVRAGVVAGLQQCFRKYGVAEDRIRIDLRPVDRLEPIQPGSNKVCRFWNRLQEKSRQSV